jgi:hypothetical protein
MTGDHLGISGTTLDGQRKTRLFLHNGDEKQKILVGNTELPFQQWIHVVLTREGNNVSLYIDGQLDVTGEVPRTFSEQEPTMITVGNRSDHFFGFEGKISEVAVYSEALTPEKIKQHRNVATGVH